MGLRPPQDSKEPLIATSGDGHAKPVMQLRLASCLGEEEGREGGRGGGKDGRKEGRMPHGKHTGNVIRRGKGIPLLEPAAGEDPTEGALKEDEGLLAFQKNCAKLLGPFAAPPVSG
jgi:hypothetical protein